MMAETFRDHPPDMPALHRDWLIALLAWPESTLSRANGWDVRDFGWYECVMVSGPPVDILRMERERQTIALYCPICNASRRRIVSAQFVRLPDSVRAATRETRHRMRTGYLIAKCATCRTISWVPIGFKANGAEGPA